MGKTHRQAALDGTQEIGLAVLATTFSIVAVFLPVGFMGGIIGKFFHEFGITIVAAVLISMFVCFTLDPMLSSVWHDPQAHGTRPLRAASSTRVQERVTGVYRARAGLGAALAQARRSLIALATFAAAASPCRARHRVRAQGRLRRAGRVDLDAGRLVARSDRGQAAPGRRRGARVARGRYTYGTINTGYAPARSRRASTCG